MLPLFLIEKLLMQRSPVRRRRATETDKFQIESHHKNGPVLGQTTPELSTPRLRSSTIANSKGDSVQGFQRRKVQSSSGGTSTSSQVPR